MHAHECVMRLFILCMYICIYNVRRNVRESIYARICVCACTDIDVDIHKVAAGLVAN